MVMGLCGNALVCLGRCRNALVLGDDCRKSVELITKFNNGMHGNIAKGSFVKEKNDSVTWTMGFWLLLVGILWKEQEILY